MKPISEIKTNQPAQTKPCNALSKASHSITKEKASQVLPFVRQCFDMQNTFGLTPEQLENRMRGIVEDIGHHDMKTITGAFIEWRRSSPIIPTPFDMVELCKKHQSKNSGHVKFVEFDGTWCEYQEYLNKHRTGQ